jgi:hypothetical protein
LSSPAILPLSHRITHKKNTQTTTVQIWVPAQNDSHTKESFACHFEKSERGCEEGAEAIGGHIQIAE